MAGPAPKTRNWMARENKHKPKGLHIIVGGEVDVIATNKSPELTEAPSVGKTLPLDLSVIDDRDEPLVEYRGKPVKVWTPASFHKVVSVNQFERVSIRWDGKEIANVPVLDDREHSQHLGAITAAANTKYGKRPAKPPKPAKPAKPPKPPAKKAAPKKAAAAKKKPKSVGGWAKPKKAKKSAKKAAKKTAKKSAFKKFVRKLVKTLTPASKKKSKKR